ncbi:MAG: carboxypeptidase-like regulatory domain-containing protein, partial [Bacteroidota bacterium]
MLRNLLFTIALVLTANLLVFSQTGSGTLKGKISDKSTKEGISFANIVVEIGGVQVGGATSDMDGNYLIKPVPPGKIDLKATFVGYRTQVLKSIVIFPDKITFQNIDLEPQTTTLQEVEVVEYKVPLISKDQTTSGGTVTSEEIAKMANKSADAVATTVGGVGTDANGNITSLRGQRSSGTVYYIDGMRVIGSNSLPQSAIEQVEVILGGTPAAYGDATGGIISVTTKGPSREFATGLELSTSKFLDRFGYAMGGLSLTGPLFSKKDTITKSKTPIMGYFIAGQVNYQQDGAPAAFELTKLKDDVLNDLRANPLKISNDGAVFMKAEYLTANDFEKTKHTLNTTGYSVNLSAKLDLRVSRSINMSFGGTYNMNDGYGFSYFNSLMNYMYNGHNSNNTWRVNARFTQRFPTASDTKSFIKNVYYSIGADFSRSYAKSEDADHKDNPFQYGYIGKYNTFTERAYTGQLTYDTVSGKWAHIQNGKRDTLVEFTPFNFNPESANWTAQYYNSFPAFDPTTGTGYYRNEGEIVQNRGLVNGMQPSNVYNTFANVGTR